MSSSRLFFLLSFLFTSITSSLADDFTIELVCDQTFFPSFCRKILSSDPRSSDADVPGLALVAIDAAMESTAKQRDALKELTDTETDPVLKKRFFNCTQNFGEIYDNLNECRYLLTQKDYNGMNATAAAIGFHCDEQFDQGPPPEPDFVVQRNRIVQDYDTIARDIVILLQGI